MASVRPYRGRRAPSGGSLPLLLGVLLGGGALVGGGLWAGGALPWKPPWAAKVEAEQRGLGPAPPGTRLVILCPEDLPAHTRLDRDVLFDLRTLRPRAYDYIPEDRMPEGMLTTLGELAGRVLARDKPALYAFTESDFLPKGTRPGLVAGIPVGKRAMRLQADRVAGLFGLQAGDRFDVIAVQTVDAGEQAVTGLDGVDGASFVPPWLRKQARVRTIVDNGLVIEAVHLRQKPVSSTSLTRGQRTTTVPVQEVVVAIDPEEVASLTEAMAVGAQITCLPRSGRPDDAAHEGRLDRIPNVPVATPFGLYGDEEPGEGGVPRFSVVETISGEGRRFQAVPAGRAVPPADDPAEPAGGPSGGDAAADPVEETDGGPR